MILNNNKVDLLLRYSGGKYYALKQLGKFWLEKKHKKYVEPFFGGGSVFLDINSKHQCISHISDYNSDLIFNTGILVGGSEVIKTLRYSENLDRMKQLTKELEIENNKATKLEVQ